MAHRNAEVNAGGLLTASPAVPSPREHIAEAGFLDFKLKLCGHSPECIYIVHITLVRNNHG